MMRRAASIAAGVILLALTGCSGDDDAAQDAGQGTSAVEEQAEAPAEEGEGSSGGLALGGEDAPAEEEDSDTEAAPLPPQQVAATGDRVIKEGTVSLEVEAGAFDRAYAAVVEAARRLGGSVVASTTQAETDGGGTSGSVTVRVPVDNYEDLLVGVGDIGTVRAREVSAEDVSTEFVDLEARQRHLEAQERFYLELLGDAEDVPDAIAVQQQLDDVTEQLERVKGRLAYLGERTSFSTLTVELFEPDASAPVLAAESSDGPSLARSWQVAKDAFVNVVGTMLVVASFLAPLLAVAGVALLLWRALQPRPAAATPPEEKPPTPDPDLEPSLTP